MTLDQPHPPTATEHPHEQEIPSGDGHLYVQLEGEPATIPVSEPAACGHVERVCINCLYWWAVDHDISLDHTPAGRDLAKRLRLAGTPAATDPKALRVALEATRLAEGSEPPTGPAPGGPCPPPEVPTLSEAATDPRSPAETPTVS